MTGKLFVETKSQLRDLRRASRLFLPYICRQAASEQAWGPIGSAANNGKAAERAPVRSSVSSITVIPFLPFSLLLLWLMLSLTTPALASDTASPTLGGKSSFDDVEVERFDFGVVTDRNGYTEDWKLHPVVVIPNLPGIQYAWRIKTKGDHPVFVREEFSLPEPPSTWKIKGGESSSELKNGGEQCILESFQTTEDGWIGHAWTASSGDPGGRYEIKVYLNGKFAHHFIFNVADALPEENESKLP